MTQLKGCTHLATAYLLLVDNMLITNILLAVLILLILVEANNLAKLLAAILEKLEAIHNSSFLNDWKESNKK